MDLILKINCLKSKQITFLILCFIFFYEIFGQKQFDWSNIVQNYFVPIR